MTFRIEKPRVPQIQKWMIDRGVKYFIKRNKDAHRSNLEKNYTKLAKFCPFSKSDLHYLYTLLCFALHFIHCWGIVMYFLTIRYDVYSWVLSSLDTTISYKSDQIWLGLFSDILNLSRVAKNIWKMFGIPHLSELSLIRSVEQLLVWFYSSPWQSFNGHTNSIWIEFKVANRKENLISNMCT